MCRPVRVLCFWGPRAEKKWKRPVLFLCSVPILALGLVPLFLPLAQGTVLQLLGLYVLFGFILFIAVLGILVSLFGCNACVARLMADGF